MKRQYAVYWYRLPEHSNPYSEGYIGITNDTSRRCKEHMRNSKASHFTHAIAKYGKDALVFTVLHEDLVKEEANELEYQYRPTINIGWNMAEGGVDTLTSIQSSSITLYHVENYVIRYDFTSITEAATTLAISEGRLRQAKYRKSMTYGYDGWAILHDEVTDRSTTLTIAQYRSQILSGKSRSKESHFKGMKNRWTVEEKARIGAQHKGKTISEEQKRIVQEKHRATHSSCKSISLVHSTKPAIIHTFHSISEAARQLDIPLSRLKSKALRPLNATGNDGWKIIQLGSE